jgi:hypothetical protein
MKKKELEKLFCIIAKRNDTAEQMIRELRGLESAGEISSSDYDYLLREWDRLLGKYDLF